METLNYVDMPEYFTRLLAVDMSSTSSYHVNLQTYIVENPSLKGVVNRIFNRGNEGDINSQIKSLGWHGIRDRLLAYYVNFAQTREHALNLTLDCVDEILDLEKRLRFSTVSGFSRVILYGMFLKLSAIDEDMTTIKEHPLYPNDDILEVLKYAKERVINIDYLILHLHHLISIFGKENLITFIKQDFSYESLYVKMKEEQIEEMSENFITYCASIGEDGIFTESRI